MLNNNLKTFPNAIDDVRSQIFDMATIVEKEINLAVESLTSSFNQEEKMNQVYELDQVVDQSDYQIQTSILQLITILPPLPNELQKLTAMIRISREYERIGDHAVNIAEISPYTNVNANVNSSLYQRINEMFLLTSEMLEGSMEVLKSRDGKQATEIVDKDDQLDQYFIDNQQYIIQEMRQDNADIKSLANLLLVNRYLERCGDHIVNVMRQIDSGNY